tara:strand:+ start:17313 stop:17945 length:633 start_codon:yes stop_codon:yes gene_type:complete
MKKIIIGLSLIFIGSQMFMSCSSENAVVSQFSKRKYLKNFKENKLNNNDKINQRESTYELAEIESKSNEEITLTVSITEEINLSTTITENNQLASTVETSAEIIEKEAFETLKSKTDYNWNSYNRTIDFSKMNDANKAFKGENIAKHNFQSKQAHDLVLILCGIFLPPLGVFLYEGTITNNFWLDLLLTLFFWLPGIIYAFLVMYGGVSI